MPNTTTPIHKVFTIANFKLPLILDVEQHNYDTWRALFLTPCTAYDAKDQIEATYDRPKTRPTDPEWLKVDAVVSMWMFTTMTQALLNSVLETDDQARDGWLKLEKHFLDNKDARCMQIDKELRNISMGDLSVNQYCSKIKSLSAILLIDS